MTEQHFYDERINAACGRIYHRGILYATVVALCYGLLHFWALSSAYAEWITIRTFSSFYVFFLPETTIFISGCVILLAGVLLHGRAKDERELFEKHNYYLSAAKVFVIVAFIGYAFTIPFSTEKLSNDVPLNYLTRLFETLGVIYLYYAFKKRDIFFNYSFIHESKGPYYKRVLLNIAKLAGVLFLGFFGAALLDLGMHGSFLNFFAILIAYVTSVLSLGLEYLFISWTEKLSHDEVGQRGLHIGTFIQFIFLLINTFVAFLVMLLLLEVSNGALGQALIEKGFHLGEIVAELTTLRKHFAHESSVLTAMMLCKFMCQIRDCKVGRRAIAGILLLTAVSFFWGYVTTFSIYVLQSGHMENALQDYVYMTNVVGVAETVVNAILWTVLISDLVKTAGLTPCLWIVAGARWVITLCGAVSSLVGHHGFSIFYSIAGGLLGLASLVLLLVFLHRHQYPHEHEEFV